MVNSSIIFLPALFAAFSSLPSIYWYFPLMFISISILGYNLKSFFFLDLGILLSLISYFFVNRGGDPSNLNVLLLTIGTFFLFLGVWFYARNLVLISGIRKRVKNTKQFKIAALSDISTDLFIAVFLSLIASFIGMNSFIGVDMSPQMEMLLVVILSFSVFFVIYLIIRLLSLETE